jgi:hypothetical protein
MFASGKVFEKIYSFHMFTSGAICMNRREFLKVSVTLGAGVFLSLKPEAARKVLALGLPAIPGGTLAPNDIPKYMTPLLIRR